MVYIDYNKYDEDTKEFLVECMKHQPVSGEENLYMTNIEKQEFLSNLKKLIDYEKIPFEERMVILAEVCRYSREVMDFLFPNKN